MDDRLEENLSRIGGPRPLEDGFRARLERSMAEATGAEPAPRWRIDGPRDLPASFRARLEAGLTRSGRRFGSLSRGIAAAVVLILAAGTTLIVVDRLGAPDGDVARPASPAPGEPASEPTGPGSLRAFRTQESFLSYVRGQAMQLAGPYGIDGGGMYGRFRGPFSGPVWAPVARGVNAGVGAGVAPGGTAPIPAAAPGEPGANAYGGSGSFSSTNVQEEGVDEPDIVKTDGRRLIVMSGPQIYVLTVDDGRASLQGTVRILNGVGLFLAGDKVLHFASLQQAPTEASKATHAVNRPWTKVSVIDIAQPSAPKVVSSMSIEGNFVGARLVRGAVRLIVQSGALGPAPVTLRGSSADVLQSAKIKNVRAIRASSVGDWVPHFIVKRSGRAVSTGHVHDWAKVSRPPDKAGVSMLTIVTIDPVNPRPDNAESVIGAGEIVYSSLDNLYVTSGRLDDVIAIRRGAAPKGPLTRIHKFDIRHPARAIYKGSGEIPGFLLNQFAISEHDGHLRVATTLAPPGFGGGASSSSLFVLRQRGAKLITVGSVGKLGVGERIFSVRFIGTKAYVVTFRQIDPLYVLDLRVPERPRLTGQLKVPGYSGYLHPLSDTLLLGIGRDADPNGQTKGVQLSLFDVSNPAKPRRLDNLVAGAHGASEVENDHHSFLYWAARRLAVTPITTYDNNGTNNFVGALAVVISRASLFGDPVRLTHTGRANTENADVQIRRSLVIGDRLITISNAGVLLSDLQTLASRNWVPFQD